MPEDDAELSPGTFTFNADPNFELDYTDISTTTSQINGPSQNDWYSTPLDYPHNQFNAYDGIQQQSAFDSIGEIQQLTFESSDDIQQRLAFGDLTENWPIAQPNEPAPANLSSSNLSNESLISEAASSTWGELVCKVCGKKFSRPADLRKHQPIHLDPQNRKHRCDVCGMPFLYPKDIKRHKASAHPNDETPQFFCHVQGCSRAEGGNPFPRKDKLQEHLLQFHHISHEISTSSPPSPSSTSETATCSFCGREFSGKYRKGNLERHMRQKHLQYGEASEGRGHICPVCGKNFQRSDALRKHKWVKHGRR